MPKNLKFKRKESLGFIIMTDSAPIFIDEEGEFWLGGLPPQLSVAVFSDKFEARSTRTVLKNRWKGLIKRTRIYEVFNIANISYPPSKG